MSKVIINVYQCPKFSCRKVEEYSGPRIDRKCPNCNLRMNHIGKREIEKQHHSFCLEENTNGSIRSRKFIATHEYVTNDR